MNAHTTEASTDSRDAFPADTAGIRQIAVDDLREVLRSGKEDFYARPTHGVFLTVIYLLVAAATVFIGLGENLLFLLFPVVAGFALIGPLAACGLYELSRRREQGENYAWWHVFDVLSAPSRWAIAGMGVILALLFISWLVTAVALYGAFFGDEVPATATALLQQLFMTTTGWQLLLTGGVIGFAYSIVVFVATVVSLPMMVDRRVSLLRAVTTSLRAVQLNWKPMAAWYLTVVGFMLLGSIPLLIGLGVLVPIMGHATWHLYRSVLEWG